MSKMAYYSVHIRGFNGRPDRDVEVRGKSYKTVAKRFFGDNLDFNIMHYRGMSNIPSDVQVLKTIYGRKNIVGRIIRYDESEADRKAESQRIDAWYKSMEREYKKAGGKSNFGRR